MPYILKSSTPFTSKLTGEPMVHESYFSKNWGGYVNVMGSVPDAARFETLRLAREAKQLYFGRNGWKRITIVKLPQ